MKLAGRIQVEPLDDERLVNIERRIVAGVADTAQAASSAGARRDLALRAPGRLFGGAVAAIALAAAAVVGWALHAPSSRAPVIGDAPPLGVQTGPERSVLDLGDARIASDPGTAFDVTRPAGGVLVAMARGRVELDVAKRGQRPPLIVRAGDTDVIVVGTHFAVDYGDGTGDVAVRVTEGVVRVVHLQQETRVAAGQAWRTREGLIAHADGEATERPEDADGPPRPQRGSAPAVAQPRGALPDRPADHRRSEPSAPDRAGPDRPADHVADGTALDRAASDRRASDRTASDHAGPDRPPFDRRPGRATAPAVALSDRTPAVPDAAGPTPTAPSRLAIPSRAAGRDPARPPVALHRDPEADLRAAIRAERVDPALDLGEPDAERAIARYYEIAAHRSGDEASQAFYSIAAVRHLRLGRNADALQTLDAYVRRFPGGKEYRAALWLRVRILCLDKIDDRCRAAAYTYLHQVPDTPAAHIAERITQS